MFWSLFEPSMTQLMMGRKGTGFWRAFSMNNCLGWTENVRFMPLLMGKWVLEICSFPFHPFSKYCKILSVTSRVVSNGKTKKIHKSKSENWQISGQRKNTCILGSIICCCLLSILHGRSEIRNHSVIPAHYIGYRFVSTNWCIHW